MSRSSDSGSSLPPLVNESKKSHVQHKTKSPDYVYKELSNSTSAATAGVLSQPMIPVPPPPPPPPPASSSLPSTSHDLEITNALRAQVRRRQNADKKQSEYTVSSGSCNVSQLVDPSFTRVPVPPPLLIRDVLCAQIQGTVMNTKQQQNLSFLHKRFTPKYMRNWVLQEDNLTNCLEDVGYAVRTLKAVQGAYASGAEDYKPYFRLIYESVVPVRDDVSQTAKEKVMQELLDCGWVQVINVYLKLLIEDVINPPTNKEGAALHLGASCDNMVSAIDTLRHPIHLFSTDIVAQIFDLFYNIVIESLQALSVVELPPDSRRTAPNRLMNVLISALLDFLQIAEMRRLKFKGSDTCSLETLLQKYVIILSKTPLQSLCLTALSFLASVEDEIQSRFSVRFLQTTKLTDDNKDQFMKDALFVAQYLATTSLENHMKHPWRYQYEFGFVTRFATGKPSKSCSIPTQRSVYEAMIKDGRWDTFITGLYKKVMDYLDANGDDKLLNPTVNTTLVNIYYGFLLTTNGVDILKNSSTLQTVFNHYHSLVLSQLQVPRVIQVFHDEVLMGSALYAIGRSMMMMVHNFTYRHEPSVPVLRELGMIRIARDIRAKADISNVKTTSLLIIAYLLDEGEDKEMMKMADSELKYLIADLEKSLLSATASIFGPQELIEGLTRIAVVDENKSKLIDQGILPLLVKSLKNSRKYDSSHQAAAAKALWTLAFNDDSRQRIIDEKGCMNALNNLKDSENPKLKEAVAGALWELGGKSKRVESNNFSGEGAEKHIMLSYNHEAQNEVLKMNTMLKNLGYKVWVDVEKITEGGSTLEAMADAIEGSYLVLIFFSEAYKKSANCHSEADYVFEKRKQFLPIQAQPGYKPDGWLGMLMGTRYRYTLVRPDRYEAEMNKLLQQIQQITSSELGGAAAVEGSTAAATSISSEGAPVFKPPVAKDFECKTWTHQKVAQWLSENNLSHLKEVMKDFDGLLLVELVKISTDVSTLYGLLGKVPGISLADTLKLGREIQKLFK